MLSHYELMHGLALISNLRLRKYLDLIEAQRAKKTVEEDPLDTLRKAMRQEASINPLRCLHQNPVGQHFPPLRPRCWLELMRFHSWAGLVHESARNA